MSDITLNGRRVLDATITFRRRGAWHAELEVDTADVLGPDATIEATGGLRLAGTVYRGGVYQRRAYVQVIGGRGGLAKPLAPQYYRDAPLRIPVRDLLTAAGETLSTTADASLLDSTHGAWARERAPASTALAHLLDTINAVWRVLPDGTVWIGRETWPAVDVEHDLLSDSPVTDTAAIATDNVPGALMPGTVFRERRINKVVHRLTPSTLRTTIEYEPTDNLVPDDRDTRSLGTLVRLETRRTIYYGLFPARVVTQAADGTLEVIPDDADIPPMTGVLLRTFAPGVTVKLGANARVHVGFEAGDPRRPYASLFDSGATSFSEIKLGANASRGVARIDDALNGGTLAAALVSGAVQLTYTPPGGLPQVGASVTLGGKISSASEKIEIE